MGPEVKYWHSSIPWATASSERCAAQSGQNATTAAKTKTMAKNQGKCRALKQDGLER